MYKLLRKFGAWIGLPALASLILGPSPLVVGAAQGVLWLVKIIADGMTSIVGSGNSALADATGWKLSVAYEPLLLADLLLALILVDAFAEFGVHSYWSHVWQKRGPLTFAWRVFLLWTACLILVALLAQMAAKTAGLSLPDWAHQLMGGPAGLTILDFLAALATVLLLAAIFFWHPGIGWRVLAVCGFVFALAQIDLAAFLHALGLPVPWEVPATPAPPVAPAV